MSALSRPTLEAFLPARPLPPPCPGLSTSRVSEEGGKKTAKRTRVEAGEEGFALLEASHLERIAKMDIFVF